MFGALGAVLLGLAPANERDRQRLREIFLPAGDLRQHLCAGAAAGVGEQEHDRLAGGEQGIQREPLARRHPSSTSTRDRSRPFWRSSWSSRPQAPTSNPSTISPKTRATIRVAD